LTPDLAAKLLIKYQEQFAIDVAYKYI